MDPFYHLFSAVCGQQPDHTWSPGSVFLPCCQRCLGLYAGAAVALALHRRFKPKLTGRFLEVHGLFLFVMLPFGFHWLPQGPVLRTLSGILFGFGVVTFLWLPIATRIEKRRQNRAPPDAERPKTNECETAPGRLTGAGRHGAYVCGLLGCMLGLPPLAACGGEWAAFVLSVLAVCGLTALIGLAMTSLCLVILAGFRLGVRLRRTRQVV
jgi:uncharacterized membrane protein